MFYLLQRKYNIGCAMVWILSILQGPMFWRLGPEFVALLGDSGIISRWSLAGGSYVLGGCLWGGYWHPTLSFSHFVSQEPWVEQPTATCSCQDGLYSHRYKVNMGLNIYKCGPEWVRPPSNLWFSGILSQWQKPRVRPYSFDIY
jgi:hypothetical protein